MYCAYAEGGPLLLKGPRGLLVATFSTRDLLQDFVARKPVSVRVEPIELARLGTSQYPVPEQRAAVRHALLFDSPSVIESFIADADGFPFQQHTVSFSTNGV